MRRKQKIILLSVLLSLTVATICAVIIAVSYKNKKDDKGHEHSFSEWSGNQPTCTESVKQTRTCSGCGIVDERILPATGHNLTHYPAKSPTCTEDGHNAYDACSSCTYTTKEVKAKLNHSIKSFEAKEATCTEDGYNAYEACDRCSYSTKEVIPAAHKFENKICSVCGASECDECNYGDWYGNTATCEAGGVEYRECSECGHKETRETEKSAHKYENKVCIWCGKKDYTLPSQPL